MSWRRGFHDIALSEPHWVRTPSNQVGIVTSIARKLADLPTMHQGARRRLKARGARPPALFRSFAQQYLDKTFDFTMVALLE